MIKKKKEKNPMRKNNLSSSFFLPKEIKVLTLSIVMIKMPTITVRLLDDYKFSVDETKYATLLLKAPVTGGNLKITGRLISTPSSSLSVVQSSSESSSDTSSTTIDEVSTSTTTRNPKTRQTLPTGTGNNVYSFDDFLNGSFSSSSFVSTFNIWIGTSAQLVYSSNHYQSFTEEKPIKFFNMNLTPIRTNGVPSGGGGGGTSSTASMFGRLSRSAFGSFNPFEINYDHLPYIKNIFPSEGMFQGYDFGETQSLNVGYHPVWIEGVLDGAVWSLTIDFEYTYEYSSISSSKTDYPIISDILLNKTFPNIARISWKTDVVCDRNWVTYGTENCNENVEELSSTTRYPISALSLNDGTTYWFCCHSSFKGMTTNTKPFQWKMPSSEITKTGNINPLANSQSEGKDGKGIQGDEGIIVNQSEENPLIRRNLIPILLLGGGLVAGVGGIGYVLLKRKK